MTDAEGVLNRGGLYLDELTRKLRLLHPDYHQLTQEIVADLEEYFQVAQETEAAAVKLSESLKVVVAQTNKERMEVVGKRSKILLVKKDAATTFHQMQAALQERRDHLEKLNLQLESLQQVETEAEEAAVWLVRR